MRRCTACGATVVVLGPSRGADADEECGRCGALATTVVDKATGRHADRLVREAARKTAEDEKNRREAAAAAFAATAGSSGDPQALAIAWLAQAAREGPPKGRRVAAQARLLLGQGLYRLPLAARSTNESPVGATGR